MRAGQGSRDHPGVESGPDSLDDEVVAGIINFLMRIDARLEKLEELLAEEDDDGEENDA